MSEDIFETASRKAKDRALPLNAMVTAATALVAAGEIAKARALYDIWTGVHGDDPQLHIALFNGAALSAQQGDPVAAEAALRRAIALNPDFLPAHINLGGILERAGAIDAAINNGATPQGARLPSPAVPWFGSRRRSNRSRAC